MTHQTHPETPADNKDADAVHAQKIKRLSRIARWFSMLGLLAFAVLALLLFAALFTNIAELESLFDQDEAASAFIKGLPVVAKLSVFIILMAGILPGIIGFFTATVLFSSFGKGRVFTQSTTKHLRLIGWMIVLVPFASALSDLLFAAVLALFDSTPKELKYSLDIGPDDMMAIAYGLLFVILGRVMAEAIKISDENRLFV